VKENVSDRCQLVAVAKGDPGYFTRNSRGAGRDHSEWPSRWRIRMTKDAENITPPHKSRLVNEKRPLTNFNVGHAGAAYAFFSE